MDPATVDRPDIVEDAPIAQVVTEDFIASLERAAALYQTRYLPLCVKLTNEADWINHGSVAEPKYSLQCSGAEKVCTPLGITWGAPVVHRHEREDDKGKYYEYEIEGIVHSRVLGRHWWFTGNCSSRDQFFTARGVVDEGDIRKSAFSNWLVNAVTRLAGIRNPSPDLLERGGLKLDRIGRIDYSGRRSPERDAEVVSEAQRKRLWAIARQRVVEEPRIAKYLKDKYGIESTSEIKRRDYDAVVAWVERGGKDDEKPAP